MGKKMKILWLCPEIPYPLTSGLLRVYELLRELGPRHEITFLCLTRRKEVTQNTIDALAPFVKAMVIHSEWDHEAPTLVRLISKIPFFGPRLFDAWRKQQVSKDMTRTVQRLVQSQPFDVVLYGGRYTLRSVKDLKLPLVVDCCDAHAARFLGEMRHAPLYRRPLIYLHYLHMRRLERKMTSLTPFVSFVSDRDRVASLGPGGKSEILPQGVDYKYWSRQSGTVPTEDVIVFTGAMDYTPNADAAQFLLEKVLPLVRQAVPRVRAYMVGRDPLPQLLESAKQVPGVSVTGLVPDVRPYLERASVYVAPLRFASGVQNKVLEAMAMELPVVTTPAVADGLTWDGERAPVLVETGAEEIARQIIRLLADAELRADLGRRGREFVIEHCRWSRSAEKLEEMCRNAWLAGQERDRNRECVESQVA